MSALGSAEVYGCEGCGEHLCANCDGAAEECSDCAIPKCCAEERAEK